MNLLKKIKKGQALPLNTIVIAILVIVVLLVIIVFFTSSVGDAGDSIKEHSVSECRISNPVLSTLGYIGFQSKDQADNDKRYKPFSGVSDCYVSKDDTTKNDIYKPSSTV